MTGNASERSKLKAEFALSAFCVLVLLTLVVHLVLSTMAIMGAVLHDNFYFYFGNDMHFMDLLFSASEDVSVFVRRRTDRGAVLMSTMMIMTMVLVVMMIDGDDVNLVGCWFVLWL